jgi:predicted homoserine dehydrogenase-like protein
MAGEGDNGNTVLLGVSLNAGIAQPGLIIVAVAVEQIQHRELVRQGMAVGIPHIAGGKGRQNQLDIHRIPQGIGKEITVNLCHDMLLSVTS